MFHPGCGIEEADFQLTSSFRLVASEGEFEILLNLGTDPCNTCPSDEDDDDYPLT